MAIYVIKLIEALGYSIGTTLLLIFLVYLFHNSFKKVLESFVSKDLEAIREKNNETLESLKNEYKLVLEDKKAELARKTEQFKSRLFIEAETYKMVAQKRFECLLSLWESSESLFKVTNFSDINSIKESLKHVDKALSNVEKYSVLLSVSTTTHIRKYLENLLIVLTNSEKKFKEKNVKNDQILNLLRETFCLSLGMFSVASTLGLTLMDLIVPSITKHLEEKRCKFALEARENLKEVIRLEFGVWIYENKTLDDKEAK